MPRVLCKEGVQFAVIAAGGFRLLSALQTAAFQLNCDFLITAGTNGTHSGPDDPHYGGRAYDVHSKSFSEPEKQSILRSIMAALNDGEPQPGSGGLLTNYFFGWLEGAGTANEHFHIQQRRGTQL